MTSRQTREAAGGVLSFTFLDVLTCTMGSLVLLVLVLGDKAADTRLEDALRYGPKPAGMVDASDAEARQLNLATSQKSEDVTSQLAELQKREAELAELRKRAAERLDEETARVRHLEEHQRRLEHELAQLHITLERLQEAEEKQSVDQVTAERDLKRLKQLIADTEKQLQDLREQPAGKKSYAVVPYEGKFATHRRPIYIECTAEEAIIQPEGIRFSLQDLSGPIRSGNPLASAVRAAHHELNERARAAGQQEMPDPYPLILVRPEGAVTFWIVQQAIESWDVQYGYELIESDWNLEFPETDPRLVQAMSHAAEQARDRQALLARAAPRTYGSQGGMTANAVARTEAGTADARKREMQLHGVSASAAPGNAIGGHMAPAIMASSDSAEAGPSEGANATQDGHSGTLNGQRYGKAASDMRRRSGNFADQFGAPGGEASTPPPPGAASDTMQTTLSGISPAAAGPSAPAPIDVHAAPNEQSDSNAERGKTDTTAIASTESANHLEAQDRSELDSAAKTRGSNWANQAASQRATPVTRPIRVVVSKDQLQLLSDDDTSYASPTVVSFQQPTEEVLDELASAVRKQVHGWGLAGKSMYWRPTLVLHVAPGADRHAIGLNDLLRDSGLDVRFQDVETAVRSTSEEVHATR